MATLVEDILHLIGRDARRFGACDASGLPSTVREVLDLTPEELIAAVEADEREKVLGSRSIWLLSGCQSRRVACENDMDFVGMLGALRQIALESGVTPAEPGLAALMKTFRDQIKSRNGRAHHRALLVKMRSVVANPGTESTQEFALALKGKLRFYSPKAPLGKEVLTSGETLAYFPGCLTTESAREYDASIRLVVKNLGISFKEIPGWRCCGGGIEAQRGGAHVRRNAELAGAGRTIVSGCPICIARTQEAAPDAPATHLLGILTRPDVLAKLAAKIKSTGEKRPVGSLTVAAFYGCELSDRARWALPAPPHPDPLPEGEGTKSLEPVASPIETLMEAAGARVENWGGLKRCCGGYLLYARPDLGFEMLEKVYRDFEKSGADAIVTACPHCHFNLDAFQFALGRSRRRAVDIPVLHFTEVLALAMNLDVERELERHVTSAFPLIERLVTEEQKRKSAEARSKR